QILRPQPDQVRETLHDGGDEPAAGQHPPDLIACGPALRRGPGEQLAQGDGEGGLELTPAPRGPGPVGRPRAVVDADKPGGGEQRLTGDRTPSPPAAAAPSANPSRQRRYDWAM